jgi:hypothetical protein
MHPDPSRSRTDAEVPADMPTGLMVWAVPDSTVPLPGG